MCGMSMSMGLSSLGDPGSGGRLRGGVTVRGWSLITGRGGGLNKMRKSQNRNFLRPLLKTG